MDALKEGRCLLDRVPLHRACFGISGMDCLATCKKCSPAVIRSFRIAGTESIPCATPVTSPGFHQRWSWLVPARVSAGFLLFAAAPCRQELLQQAEVQPCLCSGTMYSRPEDAAPAQGGGGDRENGWDEVSHVLHSIVPAPGHHQPALTPG